MKILEWNIHQQGRRSKTIAMDILDYINNEDIVILLEMNKKSTNFEEFCKKFNEKNYKIYMTDYSECRYANDILIAVNSTSNINVRKVSNYISYSENNENIDYDIIPENLFLDIELNNKKYVIAGIRIKDLNGNYNKRRKQMETIVSWTNEIAVPVIMLGDFNNLRTNTPIKSWNLQVLDNIIQDKLIRKTPINNHSWGISYHLEEDKYDGYIKEDHLLFSTSIIKEIDVVRVCYCWDYIIENINKCRVESNKCNIYVPIGIPDHAILKVDINI